MLFLFNQCFLKEECFSYLGMVKGRDVLDTAKTMRWTYYFTGGILIALGLFAMAFPSEALMSVTFALGVGFLLSGINHLIPCFTLKGDPMCPKWLLWVGAADLLIGVVMLFRMGVTAFMIPLFLGLWLFFVGGVRVGASFFLKKQGVNGWGRMFFNGALMFVFGFLMFASPFFGQVSVSLLLGGVLVATALLILSEARYIYS